MATTSALLGDSTLSSPHSQQQNYGSVIIPHEQNNQSSRNTSNIDAGAGSRSGSGPGSLTRTSTTTRRSVLIAVPEQDDNASISSRSSYSSYSSSCSSTDSLLQAPRSRASTKKGHDDEEDVSSRHLLWTYVALAPVLMTIWGLFAALILLLPSVRNDSMVRWDRFGIGMVGWAVAFASRTPVYSFLDKILYMDEYSCEWSTLLYAGFVEEIARLSIIKFLDIGDDFEAVYWLGLGWAGVETLYYIGQSLIYSCWLSDDDYRTVTNIPRGTAVTESAIITPDHTIHTEGVEEGVKDLEETQGAEDDIVPTHQARRLLGIDRPWWSLMGRTSSMMVHIGFCCWLGYSGWKLLLPAALIHGALYIIWGVLMPKHWSVPATSYGTLMAAMTVFLIGLALYGEIV